MECRTIAGSLSEYLDTQQGQQVLLNDGEMHKIEDHLAGCPNCRNLQFELSEIRSAARELPLRTPPRALWTRIVNEIEINQAIEKQFGVIPENTETEPQSWWQRLMARRFSLSFPQMAGAAVMAIALIVAGVVKFQDRSSDLDFTRLQSAMIREELTKKADLDRKMAAINERKASWDPAFRADFEKQLSRIEGSIDECRRKLEATPDDLQQVRTMLNLYEEKRQLLENAEKHL